MKLLFFSLMIFVVCMGACVPSKITGTYSGNHVISNTKLTLDSNSRFNYIWQEHMTGHTTHGRWTQNKRRVYLQSDTGITWRNGTVKERENPGEGISVIQVYNEDCNFPFDNLEVTINDSVKKITDHDGKIRFNTPIRTVSLVFEYRYHFYYHIKNRESNEITICLSPNDSGEIFFSNEKYILHGRTITGRDGVKLRKGK